MENGDKFTLNYSKFMQELSSQLPDITFSDDDDDDTNNGAVAANENPPQPFIRESTRNLYKFENDTERSLEDRLDITDIVHSDDLDADNEDESSDDESDYTWSSTVRQDTLFNPRSPPQVHTNGSEALVHTNGGAQNNVSSGVPAYMPREAFVKMASGDSYQIASDSTSLFNAAQNGYSNGTSSLLSNSSVGREAFPSTSSSFRNRSTREDTDSLMNGRASNSRYLSPRTLFYGLDTKEDEEKAKAKYLPPSQPLLLRFGTRGEVDLDEYFDRILETTGRTEPSFYSDPVTEDVPENSNLLNQLAALSRQYSSVPDSSNNKPVKQPGLSRTLPIKTKLPSKPTSQSNSSNSNVDDTEIKMKIPDTIFLDLRNSFPASTPTPSPTPPKQEPEKVPKTTSQDDNASLVGNSTSIKPPPVSSTIPPNVGRKCEGLWLENFRRQKNTSSSTTTSASQISPSTQQPSTKPAVQTANTMTLSSTVKPDPVPNSSTSSKWASPSQAMPTGNPPSHTSTGICQTDELDGLETIHLKDDSKRAVSKISESSVNMADTPADQNLSSHNNATTSSHPVSNESTSDRVMKKIAEIKEREETMRKRRQLLNLLIKKRPKAMNTSTPVLFHEEASFTPGFTLLPPRLTLSTDSRLYTLVVKLRSPYEIVTESSASPKSAHPIDPSVEGSYTYLALITWLLSLMEETAKPFQVIGLSQTAWSNDFIYLYIRVVLHSSKPKLHSFLEASSLRRICSTFGIYRPTVSGQTDYKSTDHLIHCTPEQISDLPLKAFIAINEGDSSTPFRSSKSPAPRFDWSSQPSFYWAHLSSETSLPSNNSNDVTLSIDNSVITITSRDLLPKEGSNEQQQVSPLIFQMLQRSVSDGLDLAGLRLLYSTTGLVGRWSVVFVMRGHDAVGRMRQICGPGVRAVFANHNSGWDCTRFPQTIDKELTTYFGPRATEYLDPDTDPLSSSSGPASLVHSRPSHLLLLVSPVSPDVGWLLHVAGEQGWKLTGLTRVQVGSEVARSQLGMGPAQIEVFASAGEPSGCGDSNRRVCHLLVLSWENAMNHATALVNQCHAYLTDSSGADSSVPHPSFLYYAMPYLPKLLESFDIGSLHQLPAVHCEPIPQSLPDPPFEDCETFSFVLLISEDTQEYLGQVLDQCSSQDLVAVKSLPGLPPIEHGSLLQREFNFKLPSSGDGVPLQMATCLLLIRGIYLHRALSSIQDNLRHASNVVFAYTLTHMATFRLAISFFSMKELKSDPKRRQVLQYIPVSENHLFDRESLMAQMCDSEYELSSCFHSISRPSENDMLLHFITLWKALDLEGFTVEYANQSSPNELDCIVKRPNAVFKLYEFADNHEHLHLTQIPLCHDEVDHRTSNYSAEINEPNILGISLQLSATKKDYDEVNIIAIKEGLLLPSKRTKPPAICLLEFLQSQKFQAIGVRQFQIQAQSLETMRKSQLRNFSQELIADEDRYLVVLFIGRLAAMVTKDIMRSDSRIGHIIKQNGRQIFLTESSTNALRCAENLFNCITPNTTVEIIQN